MLTDSKKTPITLKLEVASGDGALSDMAIEAIADLLISDAMREIEELEKKNADTLPAL